MAELRAQQVDLSVQLIQALGGGYRPGGTRAGDHYDPVPAVPADARHAQADAAHPVSSTSSHS